MQYKTASNTMLRKLMPNQSMLGKLALKKQSNQTILQSLASTLMVLLMVQLTKILALTISKRLVRQQSKTAIFVFGACVLFDVCLVGLIRGDNGG